MLGLACNDCATPGHRRATPCNAGVVQRATPYIEGVAHHGAPVVYVARSPHRGHMTNGRSRDAVFYTCGCAALYGFP